MAAENWNQKFLTNPITTNQVGDLLYFARSPYGPGNDAVITWVNFAAQFSTPAQIQSSTFNFATDTGSSGTNYVIALNPPLLANSEDVLILMTPTHTSTTTTPTLNINGLGALPIELNGGIPITIGDLLINNVAMLIYNATQNAYILQNPVNIVTQNGIIHQVYNFAIDSGAANAYVVTTLTNPIAYSDGTLISFKAAHANTGASTINVDAIGVVPLVLNGNIALPSGAIVINGEYFAMYNSTYSGFVLINPATAGAFLPLTGGTMTGNIVFATAQGIQTNTSAGNTALLQAYNTNTAAYVTFATLTANNPPTFDLSASTTIGGNPISVSPLTTKGDLFSFTTTNARLPVASGDGKILQVLASASTGLAYSTATYPVTAGAAGNAITSDGTNFVSKSIGSSFTTAMDMLLMGG